MVPATLRTSGSGAQLICPDQLQHRCHRTRLFDSTCWDLVRPQHLNPVTALHVKCPDLPRLLIYGISSCSVDEGLQQNMTFQAGWYSCSFLELSGDNVANCAVNCSVQSSMQVESQPSTKLHA